jgi:hypothetical protein
LTYLRHLETCNRFSPDHFLPLMLGSHRVGFIHRKNVPHLAAFPHIFHLSASAVTFVPTQDALTEAVAEVTDTLFQSGVLRQRRNELFAVTDGWGGPLLFKLDRGAVSFLGVRAYAVHLNGWRPGSGGPDFWIARRAMNKPSGPGKLDNMVAGGIGAGYTAWETLLKEVGEEADIPQSLAVQAKAAGAVRYRIEQPSGMRDEVLFTYDLEVPPDFIPRNTDGEVQDFRLLSARECLRMVRETNEFKFDVNLVLIDFGLRHGLITPEEPDYLTLLEGVHGSLVQGLP